MSQNTPPMDWYPDPADPQRERYWDGERWTHNTRAAQVRPAAPGAVADPWAAQGPSAPAAPVAPAAPNAPQQGQYVQQGQYPQQGQFPPQFQQVQYAQPVSGKATHTPDGVALAGWWRRVFALLVDQVIVSALTMLVGWRWIRQVYHGFHLMWSELMAQANAGQTMDPTTVQDLSRWGITTGVLNAITWTGVALSIVYFLLQWKFRGQTLGQALLGVRVVPTDEGHAPRPLGWGKALLRTATYVALNNIPYLSFLSLVSYLMPLWTAKRQTLHDMVARTQVVRSR